VNEDELGLVERTSPLECGTRNVRTPAMRSRGAWSERTSDPLGSRQL
jgi:hypothetical protein